MNIKKTKLKRNLIAYSFILPNLVGFMCFTLIPIVFSFILSFAEWDSASPIKFVGFRNFIQLFSDSGFKISLRNTLFYAIGTVPLTLVFSLSLALILNKGLKAVNFFRSLFFFPHIASLVAIAVVWNMLLHPTLGPVNQLLKTLGVANPPGWTSSVTWALPAVIIVSVWKGMGYYMVLYLAGLKNIPTELYEAASVDGANTIEKFRYITIPMLTPTTFFVCIMLTISCFKVFDLISVMTNGGPGRATNVLVLFIYKQAFTSSQFGYASAVAMVLFAIVFVITLVQFNIEKKYVNYL